MSVHLDPREVLAHLNSMGYRNISAAILKEFMKNLKRLITYETRYSLQSPNICDAGPAAYLNKQNVQDHFEKLYKATTEATKARINARKAHRENDDPYDPYKFDRIRVDEEAAPEIPKKKCKTAVNEQTSKNPNAIPSKISDNNVAKRSQSARPASATTSSHYIRNTPTDLYQNYQREWSRFKHLLPGENPRHTERQLIRKRMETIQKTQPKPKVFVLMNDDNTKVIRRSAHEHPWIP